MSFRSAREARERFLQLARRAEESAPAVTRDFTSMPAPTLPAPWDKTEKGIQRIRSYSNNYSSMTESQTLATFPMPHGSARMKAGWGVAERRRPPTGCL